MWQSVCILRHFLLQYQSYMGAELGVEIPKSVCLGAGAVALLSGAAAYLRARLTRRIQYTEKALEDNYVGDESDLVAGRAVMVHFAAEDQKDFARECARGITEEYNEKYGRR